MGFACFGWRCVLLRGKFAAGTVTFAEKNDAPSQVFQEVLVGKRFAVMAANFQAKG